MEKKHFGKIVTILVFDYRFIKNDTMLMYFLCIYKKPHYFNPI